MTQGYETILSWKAPEHKHYHKTPAWYITLVVVWLLLILYLLFQSDWFGAISLGIIGIFIITFAQHRPKTIQIELSDKGVHLEETHIPYSKIKHFWIVDNDNHRTLNIETTTYLNNDIAIELEEQDPELVREMLIAVLPEHNETEESFTQKIAHRFRF